MAPRLAHPDEVELLRRSSQDDSDVPSAGDGEDHLPYSSTPRPRYSRRRHWLPQWLTSSLLSKEPHLPAATAYARPTRRCCHRRRRGLATRFAGLALIVIITPVLISAVVWPSYVHYPPQYRALSEELASKGRVNGRDEKIFIAANIIDEKLIRGAWGTAVLGLVDLLGPENVFLSIYENDSGPGTAAALEELKGLVKCNHSIVSEHLPLSFIPSITLPSGDNRIKRIAYLAEVRNRALRPLDPPSPTAALAFDRILFLNDVVFSPLDAARLLFSTHTDDAGRADYRAACAVDFINPFKFYDTYATRDAEGYSMGVPFFPWFTDAGQGLSRTDVQRQRDAVRVRSCWGGMVAFEAKWFQHASSPRDDEDAAAEKQQRAGTDEAADHAPSTNATHAPIRFRYEPELYWDASECCLIHADLQQAASPRSPDGDDAESEHDVGIYMNPYVRVAYDPSTFWWLGITRRWERVYALPHWAVNRLAGLPFRNPRRVGTGAGVEGGVGGFCGGKRLQVLRERKEGEKGKNWESLPVE